MARQIDPWLGGQTVVLEENLLAVQLRVRGLDVKLREMETRLVRVAAVASEAKADADQVSGQTLQLEAQLAGVAAALLMLADQLSAAASARPATAAHTDAAHTDAAHTESEAGTSGDVSAAVARKVMEILTEMLP